jgi:hypothetical protein
MRKFYLLIAPIALMAFQAPSANAATFNWSFSEGGTTYGSGTITATDSGTTGLDSATDSPGPETSYEKYTVTGITGYFYNQTGCCTVGTTEYVIAGLNTSGGYGTPDNLLFYNTGAGAVDLDGVGFTLSTEAGYSITGLLGDVTCENLTSCFINYEGYSSPSVPSGYFTDGLVGGSDEEFVLSITMATPLPAALPLFGTGLGILGLFGWHRKRKIDVAIAAA